MTGKYSCSSYWINIDLQIITTASINNDCIINSINHSCYKLWYQVCQVMLEWFNHKFATIKPNILWVIIQQTNVMIALLEQVCKTVFCFMFSCQSATQNPKSNLCSHVLVLTQKSKILDLEEKNLYLLCIDKTILTWNNISFRWKLDDCLQICISINVKNNVLIEKMLSKWLLFIDRH